MEDEDALICDFAEYYHIYNYKRLPLRYCATLAAGLRPESRSQMNASGAKINLEKTLLAIIADRLGLLVWQKTEDGHKGINQPESIAEKLMAGPQPSQDMGFRTGEDFRRYWNRAVKERTNG